MVRYRSIGAAMNYGVAALFLVIGLVWTIQGLIGMADRAAAADLAGTFTASQRCDGDPIPAAPGCHSVVPGSIASSSSDVQVTGRSRQTVNTTVSVTDAAGTATVTWSETSQGGGYYAPSTGSRAQLTYWGSNIVEVALPKGEGWESPHETATSPLARVADDQKASSLIWGAPLAFLLAIVVFVVRRVRGGPLTRGMIRASVVSPAQGAWATYVARPIRWMMSTAGLRTAVPAAPHKRR